MKIVWNKPVAKKTFKDLDVDSLFIEETDYVNDPNDCLVHIKTSNAKMNNSYYIDGTAYKTTIDPKSSVIEVWINEIHLETEEE